MNNHYTTQIVQNLENQGNSKDYIIGYLTSILDGLHYLDNSQVMEYMKKAVQQTAIVKK